jgi:hypothetical protein
MAQRWTPNEDRVLRRLYPGGVPIAEIASRLGRSVDAVSERRRTLNVPARPRSRPWSEREDQLLHAATQSSVPAQALADLLDRPPEQVRRRRRALLGAGTTPRPYTPDEDRAIRDAWGPEVDVVALALRLDRSPGSVRSRAGAIGCHAPVARHRWSGYEDAALRDGYELGLTCAEIAQQLPRRTASAVVARAAKLGLASYARVWTVDDDQRLKALTSARVPVEEAARLLSRTPEALRGRARKLGLAPLSTSKASRARRRWTAAEDDQLRLLIGTNPALLADRLGRTPEAVTQRARRLGLREARWRSPHHLVPPQNGHLSPGMMATLVREADTESPRRRLALARRLGVSLAQVNRAYTPPHTVGL